ncbi:MAG: hypothetical protein ABSA92_05720 [Candidatus Bathyarchaeia archaeon]
MQPVYQRAGKLSAVLQKGADDFGVCGIKALAITARRISYSIFYRERCNP